MKISADTAINLPRLLETRLAEAEKVTGTICDLPQDDKTLQTLGDLASAAITHFGKRKQLLDAAKFVEKGRPIYPPLGHLSVNGEALLESSVVRWDETAKYVGRFVLDALTRNPHTGFPMTASTAPEILGELEKEEHHHPALECASNFGNGGGPCDCWKSKLPALRLALEGEAAGWQRKFTELASEEHLAHWRGRAHKAEELLDKIRKFIP